MTGFSSIPIPGDDETGAQSRKFSGVARVLGPRWAHLPTITVGLLGVQVFWSVEMSYASPYLLSLGLSKSSMAIVFLAGPISGLIMQPLIGVLADQSTSRFGRRRPYMMLGTLLCIAGMLLLGFTRPVASLFTSRGSSANDTLTIWLAVLAIYFIDFAINAVQAMDRALLVDTLPSAKQAAGNAWAAKMLGIGAVVGFFVGKLDLTHSLPFLGKTQLEVLSVIVSFFLFASHAITSIFTRERVLLKDDAQGARYAPKQNAFIREVKSIWTNVRTLPWVIQQICFIQFCAWIAWFPVLFYSSIYVGDFHKQANPLPSNATVEAIALLDAAATRMGSRALFYSSLVSLTANFALPIFIQKPRGAPVAERAWLKVPNIVKFHLASLWAFSHLLFALCMFATFFTHTLEGATALVTVTGFSWAITQWAPFALLAEAILTEPGHSIADDGAIQLEDSRRHPHSPHTPHHNGGSEHTAFLSAHRDQFQLGDDSSDEEDNEDLKRAKENRRALLGNHAAHVSSLSVDRGVPQRGRSRSPSLDRGDDEEAHRGGSAAAGGLSAKAGIILGIHNVFIVIPQFLVTGLSSIIFAIFDPQAPAVPAKGHAPLTNGTTSRAVEGLYHLLPRADDPSPAKANSVVYVFRIGGVAATFAFVLCWRLARQMRHR